MHAASASVALPPPLPRIGPEERLMLVSRALRVLSSSGTDCSEELSSCEMLQHLLPEVLAITDRLDPVLTHGDLSPQNLFHTPNGVVAIDWDKAGRAGPATDLSIIDPDVYCHEMRQLGRDTDRELTARAAIAGQVLAALNHDIVRKPLKKQRGYLERMLRAAQILAVEGKR